MPACSSCGGHVSPTFARVAGDAEGVVHACHQCSTRSELRTGAPASASAGGEGGGQAEAEAEAEAEADTDAAGDADIADSIDDILRDGPMASRPPY